MLRSEPLTVAVVAGPDTAASTVFGLYDLFASAGRDWDLLLTGRAGAPRARPLIVASSIEPFVTSNGVWIRPDRAFRYCDTPEVVCVPDVIVAPGEPIEGRFGDTVAWLRQCYDAGATLASASGLLFIPRDASLRLETASGSSHPAAAHPTWILVYSLSLDCLGRMKPSDWLGSI